MGNGEFCLISPWMNNGPIMEYIRDNHHINPLELVCMNWQSRVILLLTYRGSPQLKDVANGLDFLHSKDLVHGDLRVVCSSAFTTMVAIHA